MAKRRLKSLEDVRRYLANLINETRAGNVDPSLSTKLGYLLNILKSTISDSDLESRIKKLEEIVNDKIKKRSF